MTIALPVAATARPTTDATWRRHLLVLGGEVESAERRDEICRQITANFPDVEIACDIGIVRAAAPSEVEEIS